MKAVINRYENFGKGGIMVSTYPLRDGKKIGFLQPSQRNLQFLDKTSKIFHQGTIRIFHYNRDCMFMQLYCP